MKRNLKSLGLLSVSLSFFCLFFPGRMCAQSADQVGKLFEKFEWRAIGPAVMGGRTVDIEAVEKKPWIIYAAIGPSGVWKSENNGTTWNPVFHKETTVSVGDIAISPSNADIVWVGTGEATCRNSVTIGNGVYKSMDGGKTWAHMRLDETRHISRIIINRHDPNTVYVAAMGHLWGPNPERGVYKTMDGGITWKKILFINTDTGIADLAMDFADDRILYAAAYEHRRLPYHFSSGGPGSGLYKTSDGGETWRRLNKDLPGGILGRIGIDVSRSHPDVVYALIECSEGGIWRSENQGETWKRMCSVETFKRVNNRPFYYSQIRIDPTDDTKIYVFSTAFHISDDMGQKFKSVQTGIHPDHHALWINPENPLHLIEGNDGGIDISYDGGKTWQNIQHMELAEVYQVGYDMKDPYSVYCGLQDNGAWGGPSATYDPVGITNDDWYPVIGGDGFYVQVAPDDPHTVYANYQMNGLSRFNLRIRRVKSVKPFSALKEPPFRFNWNSPIHISAHDSKVIYCGGNYLFRTSDRGHSWAIISPDLSTNDPEKQKDSGGPISTENSGAEVHCTITTISESPVKKGVIWCGTDDGNVQITFDGGATWTNVVRNIKDVPPYTWCSRLEASHFEAGTAYAAFDGHRTNDYSPYVFKTTDFGKTWESIKENLPELGWVHVIREDLINKNLLFAGTEFGIFATLDGGNTWFSLKNNLPTVAVHDIAIHPRENDLMIGTHGRGVWILDNIHFLQEMSPEILNKEMHLFHIRPTVEFFQGSTHEPYSKPVYAAKNPPYGMMLTVYFRTEPKEKPKISIFNSVGALSYQIELRKKEGLLREYWNLQTAPETEEGKKVSAGGYFGGTFLPLVPPGEFTIEVSADQQKVRETAVVKPDPRIEFKDEERAAQNEALARILRISKAMGMAVTSTRNIGRQIDQLDKELKPKEKIPEPVRRAVDAFKKKQRVLEEEIVPKEMGSLRSREMALRGGPLMQQIVSLGASIAGYPSSPTETERLRLRELEEIVEGHIQRLNKFIRQDIHVLNEILKQNNLPTVKALEEVLL
ncbi:MAG: hypothetical protein WCC06_11490 [Candidatus Aminicenantales bacterium]